MATKKKELSDQDVTYLTAALVNLKSFLDSAKISKALYNSCEERKVTYKRQHKEITNQEYIRNKFENDILKEIDKAKTDLAYANIALSSYNIEFPNFDMNEYVFGSLKTRNNDKE